MQGGSRQQTDKRLSSEGDDHRNYIFCLIFFLEALSMEKKRHTASDRFKQEGRY